MGVPGSKQTIPSRLLGEYTVSEKFHAPETTASVKDAAQSLPTTNPKFITLVWAAHLEQSAAIPAQAAGTVLTVTTSIGLPGIASYQVLSGRQMIFSVTPHVGNPIAGLLLQSLDAQGVVSVGAFQSASESGIFQGGSIYTGFIGKVILKLYAAINTLAGTLDIHAHAVIFDVPAI